MKHKVEHIRAIKEMLGQLPPVEVEATELTTLEAVKFIQPEVTAAQRKGYSFEMIASVLEKNGFTVTASTLKKYRSTKKQTTARKAGKKIPAQTVVSAPAKMQRPSPVGATASPPSGRNVSGTQKLGGFTPLEDTQDI